MIFKETVNYEQIPATHVVIDYLRGKVIIDILTSPDTFGFIEGPEEAYPKGSYVDPEDVSRLDALEEDERHELINYLKTRED